MVKFENYRFRFFYPEGNSVKKSITQCVAEKESKRLFSKDIKTKIIGIGTAHCCLKDNFCKENGRKLSLSRVMKEIGLSKDQRKLVWEEYKSSKIGGRW
jgi:hypothetical protein